MDTTKTAGPVSAALVGVGGYGGVYLDLIRDRIITPQELRLIGAVDPFAEESGGAYTFLQEQGYPIYDTLETLYQQGTPELLIISTPVPLHRIQCIKALFNGSNVLCEKPLVPLLADLPALRTAVQCSGKALAVGFQWSFSITMQLLKNDILKGKLGKPVSLNTMVSWPRDAAYYEHSNWKGRIYDAAGYPVLDCIASNAASHYLHNLFYLMGEAPWQAKMPCRVEAELYRAKEIETYDTCFLKGDFDNGCRFFLAASHATAQNENPRFCYLFEHARVELNETKQDNCVYVFFEDGNEVCYGNPFTREETAQKVRGMVRYLREGIPLACTLETVVPHLRVCNALFDYADFRSFPGEYLQNDGEGAFMPRLYGDMERCYLSGLLPYEEQLPWSSEPAQIAFDAEAQV
jgi:predicted dehydrogenase